MDKISIYQFQDYKKFLLAWMERMPNEGRGQRKQLAEAISCQTPFVTHVLSGDYHFSLEQAEACAKWIGLNESETEFFLLLVIRQRAGTKSLEAFASRQLSKRRTDETILKKRLGIPEKMSPQDQMIYYSNWFYAAVHMACMNPALQTLEAMEKYFRLPLPQIVSALEFLTEHKLIEEHRSRYRVLKPVMHLEKESPLMLQHHTQWRMKAMDHFLRRRTSDLFYTGIASLSQEDFEWFRERLSELLEDLVNRVKDSKDETIVCLNLDWFELSN